MYAYDTFASVVSEMQLRRESLLKREQRRLLQKVFCEKTKDKERCKYTQKKKKNGHRRDTTKDGTLRDRERETDNEEK